ncbi:MAG: rhomboid family intramembrane serine protease [Candidatus Symbiothrix sp.]|jgi:membrane associated rhomboid family serine protease|nr:rhomboid family intramembrane serine protease [Candidatus Symbiothrix sp.]
MSYYQNNGFNAIAPVTRNLLIINFIVWIGASFISGVAEFFGLHYFQVKDFHIYQLVTYMFTHEAFSHLFFNMFALFMFGSVIERTWGTKRYLIYYLATGIGAGLVQLLVWYIQIRNGNIPFYYADYLVTIGASGAVFGLLLAFGMLFPNAPLYLMFVPIPIKSKYFVIGYGLIELIFGMSNRAGDNVAHFAHLGGMLFGIILILYWRKKEYGHYYPLSVRDKLKRLFKRKPKRMKVQYRRPETDQEYNARKNSENREIDRILEKIKYSGYNSLTDDEKKKLFDAGRK